MFSPIQVELNANPFSLTALSPAILLGFAALLEYPTHTTPNQAQSLQTLLQEGHPQAAEGLTKFQASIAPLSQTRLEEIYTGTFDLKVLCYPYVGYQLFGESYKRGGFMASLKEDYRNYDLDIGTELPDHIAVILRYLAKLHQADTSLGLETLEEMLTLCLFPALSQMRKSFSTDKNTPYGLVLEALSDFLQAYLPPASADVYDLGDLAAMSQQPTPQPMTLDMASGIWCGGGPQ